MYLGASSGTSARARDPSSKRHNDKVKRIFAMGQAPVEHGYCMSPPSLTEFMPRASTKREWGGRETSLWPYKGCAKNLVSRPRRPAQRHPFPISSRILLEISPRTVKLLQGPLK